MVDYKALISNNNMDKETEKRALLQTGAGQLAQQHSIISIVCKFQYKLFCECMRSRYWKPPGGLREHHSHEIESRHFSDVVG